MKHPINAILGILLTIGLWQVSADANLLELEKKEQAPNNLAPVSQSNSVPKPASSEITYNKKLAPKKTILTNLHADLDYEYLRKNLPMGVLPAYDGMTLNL